MEPCMECRRLLFRSGEGVVQGFKARNWFRRILTPSLSPKGREGVRRAAEGKTRARGTMPSHFGVTSARFGFVTSANLPPSKTMRFKVTLALVKGLSEVITKL